MCTEWIISITNTFASSIVNTLAPINSQGREWGGDREPGREKDEGGGTTKRSNITNMI